MDNELIQSYLGGEKNVEETLSWLKENYFPEIVEIFNRNDSRKRLALYQGENIPQNERNLTDVRTRMGLLIEFELTRISNNWLSEKNINSLYWTYVIANRFPDLEIRGASGERKLRLEIKALQCIAEEKSANFDTLLKDINTETDYLIVFLWDWKNDNSKEYNWDVAPYIYEVFVFNAYNLARLRDFYWLNSPPSNLGDAIQGFDARFAVTGSDSKFKKEQGNYGKLMRIWRTGFEYKPSENPLMNETIKSYLDFQCEVLWLGFKILSYSQCNRLHPNQEVLDIVENGVLVGYKTADFGCILGSKFDYKFKEIFQFMRNKGLNKLVKFTDKYKATLYSIESGDLVVLKKDIKPKKISNFFT